MRSRFLVSVLLLATVSPAGSQLVSSHASTIAPKPSSPALQAIGKPVVRVNGAVLTDRDLMREMFTIFPYARQHNGDVPAAMRSDIRNGAMRMMIFEELVYQEAVRRNMTVAPARLRRAEADFRQQFSNPAEFQDLLNTEFKGSQTLLLAKIKRSLLIDQLLKQEVENRSNISVAQARVYYEQNPERFRIAESYAIQTISIIPPENATPAQLKEARKKAEDALQQAKAARNYEEFGVLAEKISEDDYRVMMGDHRAVEKSKLPPAVLEAVSIMQPGQVSGLIELDSHAYTIVRLNSHIAAGKRKFQDVSGSLRDELKRKKTEELRRALNARLSKNAKIEAL